ncbi:hypothetical protein LXL04_008141 [Taraxacum kok-saghyz]
MADEDHKGELEDSSAMIALGSLLKLTETHFWVDLYTGMPYDSTSIECTETAKDEVIFSSRTENSCISVDTELSRQMNELGLPLSFCTNKEKQNGKVRGKRKDVVKKELHSHEETRDEASVNGDEMQMEDSLEHVDGSFDENRKDGSERNDWMTYWDEFYGRNYYYNSVTHESTWEAPPHMEYLDSVYVSNELKEMSCKVMDDEIESDVCKEENLGVMQHELGNDVISGEVYNEDELDKSTSHQLHFHKIHIHMMMEICITDQKKSKEKRKSKEQGHAGDHLLKQQVDLEEMSISPIITKYWCQRYLLFSKYDKGIKMDEEGWFSATPESIANHHALRCGNGIVLDCFTGVGGNAIHFALNSIHTIAIDIDPNKIEYAQHNASVYGVEHLIEFITGDSFILAQNLKADTVFLSPPWGGPQYAKARNFDIITMLKPHNGQYLFNVAKQIAPRVVMFLPRNVDVNQLAELSLSANPPWKLEVEKNFLNGKLKAITAYFTDPSLLS